MNRSARLRARGRRHRAPSWLPHHGSDPEEDQHVPVLIADVVEAMFRAVVEVPGAHEDILHLGAHAIEALGQDPDDYSDSDLLQAGVAFAGHWYGWWVKSQLEEGGHG